MLIYSLFLLFIGYALDLSKGASIISLPFASYNSTLDFATNKSESIEEPPVPGYVKLQPGTKIYFYNTEDGNLVIGPQLKSEDDVNICILNQDEDLKKISPFKNSCSKANVYSVLKSGVLVPKKVVKNEKLNEEETNKCVYQSLKPIYYVKGFKSILIPMDMLYPKYKQEQMFKNLQSKSSDSWRTDLNVSSLTDGEQGEDFEDFPEEDFEDEVVWSPEKNYKTQSSHLNLIQDTPKYSSQPNSEVVLSSEANDLSPDKTCNGEITLFVLENNGVFRRIPSDPFLPNGLRLSYSVLHNLMFKPKFLGNSDITMSYITGKNGDLIPHSENLHKVEAENGTSVSFMLSKDGGMFPVKEEKDENESISYYFNGNLVHKSRQFKETFSNSTSILLNNNKIQIFEKIQNGINCDPFDLAETGDDEKINVTKKHHLQKRDVFYSEYGREESPTIIENPGVIRQRPVVERHMVEYGPPQSPRSREPLPPYKTSRVPEPPIIVSPEPKTSEIIPQPPSKTAYSNSVRNRVYPPQMEMEPEMDEESETTEWENPPLRPRTDIFIFDEKGTRIRLIPEITENNDVVIYKLTCKGNLVRYPSCKEPEFGFNIQFQILLDEFVLVPTASDCKPFHLTYTLQENGDLIPTECNSNTFRKAPGSLIYYMLGKNNVLFPVQQVIDMEGFVSFYYQDFFLLKMKDSTEKPLHFSTKGAPMFAFFNGFTMITISSKPRLNPLRGSNWRQLKPTHMVDGPPKAMYLSGPKGETIRVAPYKNKQGATVVYELDCNGIFYRSPKDKKKCIILKSYILMKEGILIPSNDTSGYVYMMSKNGDLFPYLYPEGKIEAPLASSLKYVLCEKGILLPIKLEIIDNYICYLFKDTVVYKERVFCKSCLDRMDEEEIEAAKKPKSSCDVLPKPVEKIERDIRLFVNKDGEYVFYERQNKIFKRFPSETVPSYLKYTMGSFEVAPDGSLYQIRYQDPTNSVVNLMLEPNGDLLEDTRNVNKVRSDYYVLDSKGNLIAVEFKKTKKNLYFFKNGVRLCRVPIPEQVASVVPKEETEEKKVLPLGKDPMGIMKDPMPVKKETAAQNTSLYIPIPLKSVHIPENAEPCTDCPEDEKKKKLEFLKDTMRQASKGAPLPLALELELTDEIIEELKNWAAKCDKVLSRRQIPDEVRNYINNLSFVGSQRQSE